MRIGVHDLLNVKGLRQNVPCVLEANFRFSYIEEHTHERMLHSMPWAKLVTRRIPIKIERVLEHMVLVEPAMTIHELAQLDGITDACKVEIDRLPHKWFSRTCFS
jgi:hypothetical protein